MKEILITKEINGTLVTKTSSGWNKYEEAKKNPITMSDKDIENILKQTNFMGYNDKKD